MTRKLTLLSVFTTMLFLAANSYAMHFTLNLGDDITANKDSISFAYDLYSRNGGSDVNEEHHKMTLEGIYLDKTQEAIRALSSLLADITPIDSMSGMHSTMSFGYVKADGTKVAPASCLNIQARMEMNVLLNEAGCIVS